MKIIKLLLLGVMTVLITSCESDDENMAEAVDEFNIDGVEAYSDISVQLQNLEVLGFSGTSQGNLTGNTGGRTSGRTSDDDCGEFEFKTTEEGFMYVYDYGDGCENGNTKVSGKITVEVMFEDDINFTQLTTYENFEVDEWGYNGTQALEGFYSIDFEESFDLLINYDYTTDLGLTKCGEDDVYAWKSSGKVIIDSDSYRLTNLNEELEDPAGNVYTTILISEALVRDFSCDFEVFAYTSGITSTTYNSGEFTNDYGNGDCDNLIIRTENGESEEIDLEEIFDDKCEA